MGLGYRQLAAALVVLLCVEACAPAGPQHVMVKADEFSPVATVTGIQQFENPFGGPIRTWNLRSFVDRKTGVVDHQLYIDINYFGDWRFYETAADDTATPRRVLMINRSVGNCSGICDETETVAVELDDALLRAKAATGFRVKLSAHNGDEQIFPVTPAMIQQQLASIDALGGSGQGAPQAPVQSGPLRLGIKFAAVPALMGPLLGVASGKGVWVLKVEDGSLADKSGIAQGDVILSINGTETNTAESAQAIVRSAAPGTTLRLTMRHAGTDTVLDVKL